MVKNVTDIHIVSLVTLKHPKRFASGYSLLCLVANEKKSKSVSLQAWSGPEGSRKLRFPDYVTMAQDGGKVVSFTHRPLFTPRKYSWYSFLVDAESTPGP